MGKKKNTGKLKEYTFHVDGMHCASCEVLIEKKLLMQKGVEAVEASTATKEVGIEYEGSKPSIKSLNTLFKGDAYKFSDKATAELDSPSLLSFKDGALHVNKEKLNDSLFVVGVALFIVIGFLILNRSGLSSLISVNATSALGAFFVFGLLAGSSSCAALVGGIVLSMSKQWDEAYSSSKSTSERYQPHILFNFGRILSYAVLGALLGAIGGVFRISLTFTAILTLGISIMMIFLALQMLGVKAFQRFQFTMPKFVTRYVADEKNFNGKFMPFIIGALTFFLPCGFTITAQGLALTSADPLQGSLIMSFFALGTLPMLLLIGLSSTKFTQQPHVSDKFLKIAGILVFFFALYNINSQFNVLGLPSLNDLTTNTNIEASNDGLPPIVDGKQIIKMEALAYGYTPNQYKVRVGIPVKWEITNKGVSGCTNAIISKGLFDGEIRIDKEVVVKEFTPAKVGKYKFSCWMGMVSGIIEVVGDDEYSQTVEANEEEVVPSGASGCGGSSDGCEGGCGGGCGNPNCEYAQ